MATTTPANPRKSIVLSDESVLNSQGTRVMTAGISLTKFRANPVMLWMHNDYRAPIGKWTNLRKKDGQLIGDPEFDESDPLALELKGKWEKGYLNAASICARVLRTSEEPKYLLPGQSRVTLTGSELREVSLVTIPSNANCVTLSDDGTATELPTLTKQVNTMNEEILEALGLSDTATPADAVAEITRLKGQEIEVALSAGRVKGIVTDANKEHMAKLASADLVAFNDYVTAAPELEREQAAPEAKPTVTLGSLIKDHGKSTPTPQGKDDDRAEWSFSDYDRKDPKALLEIKLNDPDRYEALVKAYAKSVVGA